jgi:surface polysaccharide O-acyltransferase-like enzyme
MNHRLQEFDILRVMAAFSVIAIHITAGYATLTQLGYTLNQLVRFAVPMFIIISGFLLYYIDQTTGYKSVLQFYRKRFGHVLWPYFIWTVLYFIVGLILAGKSSSVGSMLSNFFDCLLWGTACYHLYFLVIIFQLYLIYPFLRLLMAKQPHFTLIITFLLTLSTQTLLYLNMINMLPLPAQWQKLYLVAFPVWIFYFTLGMYVVLHLEKRKAQLIRNVWFLFLAWLASTGLLFLDSKFTLTYATSIRPSVMLYTVCTYFFTYSLALNYKKSLSSWVAWLSKQSFLIFLMHPLFLTFLLYGSQYTSLSLWDGNLGMLILYLAVAFLTLTAVWGISHSKLAPYLGGQTSKTVK